MSAEIIPFPPIRRRAFVLKHAARMAELPHAAAERHLAHQLKIQADTMARKGIAPDLIARERRALECAIRAQVWHFILAGGAA